MRYLLIFAAAWAVVSCSNQEQQPPHTEWSGRTVQRNLDSLAKGAHYLAIYSHIYSQTEHITHNLTATVSIRNTSKSDTLFLLAADYYNTQGKLIRNYLKAPIFLAPLETVEVVIAQGDTLGGSGANFLFDWAQNQESPEPLFEAVMISTTSSQGLSFTTSGKRID